MDTEPRKLLVLGLGNVLCADDGLGIAAVEALRAGWEIPPEVEVLDGGTLGLALLAALGEHDRAILVDAVAAPGAPAGSLVRLEGEEAVLACGERLSPHQIGVADLLAAARLIDRHPATLVLIGLTPASLDLQVGCSPEVAAALPTLVECVAKECQALGHPLRRATGT